MSEQVLQYLLHRVVFTFTLARSCSLPPASEPSGQSVTTKHHVSNLCISQRTDLLRLGSDLLAGRELRAIATVRTGYF